jgi:hypothetical protein
MGAIGDLRAFTMYQAANSMAKMAEHGGGGVGANAMGMGMGAGFGMMMPGMITQAMQGAPQPGAPVGAPVAPGAAVAAGAAAGAAAGTMNFDALAPVPRDPKALVRSVAQAAGWQVQEAGDVWQVVVPVGPLRKQTVTVNFAAKDSEGDAIIAYSSVCGPSNPQNAMLLLKFNQQMVHGAFAIQSTPAGDMVAVQANQLADAADPLAVNRLITSVAWQADKAEEKLTGQDAN